MGKKAKEHKRKVEKRNSRIEQEKYMMKKQIDKLFEQRLEGANIPDLSVKLGDKDLPFSLVDDSGIFQNRKLNEGVNNLDFTDSNNDEVIDIEVIENEPTHDSDGFTTEDRNETTGSI
jgi:hypothetical protein